MHSGKTSESYRQTIREAGFVSVGLHCYVPRRMREVVAEMEQLGSL